MIALDSSSLIAFFSGDSGADVEVVDMAFDQKQAVLPPVVLAEILSDPHLDSGLARLMMEVPRLSIKEGYWERVGDLRARIIAKGFRARLADSLIAQNCLDNDVSLVTRDSDFRHFARFASLKLL